jgi:hypothetical protein
MTIHWNEAEHEHPPGGLVESRIRVNTEDGTTFGGAR